MIGRWIVIVSAAGALAAACGCGSPAGYYPVSGKVLCNGEPARGAVVYFRPEGVGVPAPPTIPSGIVEDDGSFSLSCDGIGDGCPPGKYAVLVEWRDGGGDGIVPVKAVGKTKLVKRSRMRSGPDRLAGRYFDVSKPLIHAEVLAQANSLAPFDVGQR